MATTLKGTIWGGVTFSATPAVKLKPQIYIAKGSAPWYTSSTLWKDKDKVINTDESISGQATVTCKGVTDMTTMFYGCSKLTSLDLSNFDTSNVTEMVGMLAECSGLTTLNVTNFDTSKVINMNSMFSDCSKLTSLDVSNFNTSNVTDMGGMLAECSKLTSLDLSNFDTSNVTNMNGIFFYCSGLTSLDVSNFDTSNVTDMGSMFYNCGSLTTIKGVIDMKSCKDYRFMFAYCSKLKGVKIKNPPADFESKTGLSSSQYTIVS